MGRTEKEGKVRSEFDREANGREGGCDRTRLLEDRNINSVNGEKSIHV